MQALQASQQIDIFGGMAPPVARSPLPTVSVAPSVSHRWVYSGQSIHISPTRIFTRPAFEGGVSIRSIAQRAAEANLKDNRHKGDVSAKSQNKIRAVVNWLALAAEKKRVYHKASNKVYQFKINIITLTLPDTDEPISEKDFKSKLLQPWLSYMRQYYKLNNYVWKIEAQANGKWHAHLVTDTFIHYSDLRKCWNRQLHRNGWLDAFARKHGHHAPPTEQVKSVKSVKDIAAYCAKYVSKGAEGERKIEGRFWGCNYELSEACKTRTHTWSGYEAQDLASLDCATIEDRPMYGKMKDNGFPQFIGCAYYVKGWHWYKQIKGIVKQAFDDTIHFLRTGYRDEGPIQVPLQFA